MAIETQCPACHKAYRLKDETVGKKATCKNPECRHTFTVVPTPAAVPVAASAPVVKIDAETLAAEALGEELAAPVETRSVAMTCDICEHKWAEAWERQGKNVLCPECRHRQKVPEQKVVKPSDWRQGGRGGAPSLARQPTLEGVISATDASYVTGKTLNQMGIGRPEIEARPRWHKVAFVAFPLAVVALSAMAVMSFTRSRTDTKQVNTVKLALDDLPDATVAGLPPAEVPLMRAALLMHAGEYAARHQKETPKELTEAVQLFGRARQELDAAAPSAVRDLLFLELADLQTLLGGEGEQVDKSQRVRWVPQATGTARARISEVAHSVQEELRKTFASMAGSERPVSLDARHLAIRRAARTFVKAHAPDVAERLVPVLFPNDAEQPEAFAWVGFELKRSDAPAEQIEALVKAQYAASTAARRPTPPLVALGQALPTPPPGTRLPALPAGTGPIDEDTRATLALAALLKNAPAEAIEVAKRGGRTEPRLKLLALVGESGGDPAATVQAAADIVSTDGRRKEGGVVGDFTYARLAALAGKANAEEPLTLFQKSIAKDDARAWAVAEARRQQWAAAPKAQDEGAAELPADAKDLRVGHLLARLNLARNNAQLGDAKPADWFERWGRKTGRPFGLAGQALGLQDRAAK